MKIIHFMIGKEKFTKGVVDFYNENFNNGEHDICYLMENSLGTCIRNDVSIPQYEIHLQNVDIGAIEYSHDFLVLMKHYDYIVLHSFCLSDALALYLFLHLEYCRKHIIWLEWGADLYDFKINNNKKFKNKLEYYVKKTVRENVNSVICIFPPDCEYFRQEYPTSKAKVFYAPYMSGIRTEKQYIYQSNISRLKETKARGEPIYIQIGHNAQKQLNHLESLKVLSKFKDENVMLVLPLSYSAEPYYIEEIEQYLKSVFPGKYIILKDFMPREEYFKIISRIDIAIFYTYRQTALSNIYEMINNNVKLFMPEGSVMKDYFCSLGIPIGSIECIKKQSFQEFTSTIEWEKIPGPRNFIENLNNYSTKLQHWVQIYDELRKTNE